MKYLEVHGDRVAYRDAGAGEALLLIQRPLFRGLARPGLLATTMEPGRVSCHHRYRRFAQVSNAISRGTIQNRHGPASPTQAIYNRPSSCARLTAAPRCSTR